MVNDDAFNDLNGKLSCMFTIPIWIFNYVSDQKRSSDGEKSQQKQDYGKREN